MTCPHCGTYCTNKSIFCEPPLIEERVMDNRKEAIRMIQYYWYERGNIERYCDWENQKENFSKLAFALGQVRVWKDMVDKAVGELGEEDNG